MKLPGQSRRRRDGSAAPAAGYAGETPPAAGDAAEDAVETTSATTDTGTPAGTADTGTAASGADTGTPASAAGTGTPPDDADTGMPPDAAGTGTPPDDADAQAPVAASGAGVAPDAAGAEAPAASTDSAKPSRAGRGRRSSGRAGGSLRNRVRRFLQRPGTVDLGQYSKLLPQIAAEEDRLRGLADEELADAAGDAIEDAGLCAVGREAARRALGERPFDVQLVGSMALLSGQIAEMATGEGKTLAGAVAAAGYALAGRSVHVVAVNDYLARRDAEWMRPVYDLLGVSVGWINQDSTAAERREAYAADVTYAPVSEIGFDVLRDRLALSPDARVTTPPDVALVDEADSVLIDEARVPLVLAGSAVEGDLDLRMAEIVRDLDADADYEVDEDARNVHLTEAGAQRAEEALGGLDLYDEDNLDTLTRLNVALHAHTLLQRDVDYIITGEKVRLVSESRGRVEWLQRLPDGLHAAVEAKEGLNATDTGEILDSITIESLIRGYPTVCGMTGTALAVGEQLREFYGVEVATIEPNVPCVREDEPDRLYSTLESKEDAIVAEVAQTHESGRPVLIGTLDVAESERLAARLKTDGLPCVVLNAKNDAEEAAIIAEAGAGGAITVSTQMAGRGTDIKLGGSNGDREEIADLGGLQVIGTGRHESSRLDDQLRGRAGRQGDPGSSVFFASMADDLITQYAPDEGVPGEADEDGLLTDPGAHWVLGHAQRVAEGVNLEIHRNTWRYNKLIEEQRRIVLDHREKVLTTDLAIKTLGEHCPERLEELTGEVSEEVLAEAGRQLALYHLDRGWASHIAALADVREGIHLRALGRGMDPLDEFHKEAVRSFNSLFDDAQQRADESFKEVPITSAGADLPAIGLKRPSATWTYLVQDNPFGTDIDRAVRSVGRLLGRPRSG
jgi:preprotein translocase subunit SecA